MSLGFLILIYLMLVCILGYLVYYDLCVDLNYFFYDGLYWVFVGGDWYVSSWYDGLWYLVVLIYVLVFVLCILVCYYWRLLFYFCYWCLDVVLCWGEYWGFVWECECSGWDCWDCCIVLVLVLLLFY